MRFGKQVIILSGKLRFEHLFSNIMIWFGYNMTRRHSKQVLSHVGAKGHHFLCFKQCYRFMNTTCMVELCLEPRASRIGVL